MEEVAFTRDGEAGRGWAGAQTSTGAVLAECRGVERAERQVDGP